MEDSDTGETADTTSGGTNPRRGRPRASERDARRRRVVDAALDELVDHGYDKLTMLGVASRAGASKETLYAWFGNREGLFATLIRENADDSAERVRAALAGDSDPRETLTDYAVGLLALLTSPRSVALNRAAMSSPELARLLLESGRHRVGPIVEAYLAGLSDRRHLDIEDPADAFRLLYGLIVQDTQIRVLLGEAPPPRAQLTDQARRGVDRFLELTAPRG